MLASQSMLIVKGYTSVHICLLNQMKSLGVALGTIGAETDLTGCPYLKTLMLDGVEGRMRMKEPVGQFYDSKVGPGGEEIGGGQEMPVELQGWDNGQELHLALTRGFHGLGRELGPVLLLSKRTCSIAMRQSTS